MRRAGHTRRHTLVRAAACTAAALVAAGCDPATLATSNSPTPGAALHPPFTYLAIGASDAAGVGVDEPQRDGWVPVLSRRLPQPARLVNLGIPGMKLRDAIAVQLPPALEAQPQLITIWLVVNDVLGSVPLEQYRADLDALLHTLRAQTSAHVTVGNIPTAPERSRYLGLAAAERQALAARWNEAIAGAVAASGAILVDLATRWQLPQHPEYIGPDGLHPTVAGYRTLAETFLAVLRERRVV